MGRGPAGGGPAGRGPAGRGPPGRASADRSSPAGAVAHASKDVDLVFGFRAGLAVLAKRPADVLRIACARDVVADVEATLGARSFSFGEHVSIAVLGDHELERIAHSTQHEGLCIETTARRWASPQTMADALLEKKKDSGGGGGGGGVAIALDRVRNSYNIGAILRSAAFFGVDVALLGAPAPHPALDPNAVRVAEGGAENLLLARTTDLADTLSRLRARGVKVFGADGSAETNALGDGHRYPKPAVLVLGNEREGLGPRVRAQCDALVAIRGAGAMESLNVAVAAGVLIAELTRHRA